MRAWTGSWRGNDYGAVRVLGEPTAILVTVGGRRVPLGRPPFGRRGLAACPCCRGTAAATVRFRKPQGGRGRSTALAVAAADLASRGLRVLAIDLDMEAPGLGPMLLDEGTASDFGVLDALVENGLSGLDEAFLADLVGPSALAGGRGRIDVIPVLGRRSLANPADVLAKIARAYAEDVGPEGAIATIRDQVRSLVDGFSDPTRYDAILVDARAGLHETTASAVMGLGAEVFLLGLDEPQTWQGFRVLLAHLARFVDTNGPAPEWLARFTLVQGKAPSQTDERLAFAERYRALITEIGICPRQAPVSEVSTPTGPFRDIPWDDVTPDEEVLPAEDWGLATRWRFWTTPGSGASIP